MSNFEQSFQLLIDSAVEWAILKYIEQLQGIIQKDHLLSVSELAKYTNYSKNTIKNWIHRDHDPLPIYQVDKEYRLSMPIFLEWFEKYSVGFKERKKKIIDIRVKK